MFLADQMLISFDIRIDQFSSVFSFQGTGAAEDPLPAGSHQPSGTGNNFTLLISHRSCDLIQDRLVDLVRDALVRSTSTFVRVCDYKTSLAAACSSIPSPV